MKKHILILFVIVCGFNLTAQTFVSTDPSNKNIIIEHFAEEKHEVPEVDILINHLMTKNLNRIWGINLYNYAFSYDFTCEDGLTFFNYFDPWNYDDFAPGMVNRGNVRNKDYWENSVNTILSESSCLNVAAQGSIDWDLRQLSLTVEVYYTGNSNTSENYVTVALLQNNLEGRENGSHSNPSQVLPNGNYNYLHVLRDIISHTWGDTISETTQGKFFTKTYTYIIPDTIESKLYDYLINRSVRPKVLLEDLEILVFVSESKKNIITGAKAEITHNNVPVINLQVTLDNINRYYAKCGNNFPFYVTLKNGGSDTVRSIEYNILKDNQPVIQSQSWNSRMIYPFTSDTVAIDNIYMKGGVESLISIEITKN